MLQADPPEHPSRRGHGGSDAGTVSPSLAEGQAGPAVVQLQAQNTYRYSVLGRESRKRNIWSEHPWRREHPSWGVRCLGEVSVERDGVRLF